jgi:hypothetical protein
VQKREGYFTIAELPVNTVFILDDGRVFKKGMKRRKRFECIEIATNHQYAFSPLSEVKVVKE